MGIGFIHQCKVILNSRMTRESFIRTCTARSVDSFTNRSLYPECFACRLKSDISAGRIPEPFEKQFIKNINELSEGNDMPSKKGICANCGRQQSLVAGGHCYLCYNAAKDLSGAAREEALRKVGDRVAEGITLGKRPYLRPSAGSVKWAAKKGIKKRQHPAPDPEQQETIESMQPEGCHIPEKNKLSETSPGVINLTLTFSGDDKNLYDTLIKRARSARRNPEQQLMAMLDHYLAGGLVKPIYVPK